MLLRIYNKTMAREAETFSLKTGKSKVFTADRGKTLAAIKGIRTGFEIMSDKSKKEE